MNTKPSRKVVLASRPVGIPQAEHFRIVEAPMPSIAPGQVPLRTLADAFRFPSSRETA